MIAKGLPASPGAAVGQIVFSAEDAETWHSQGKSVILVRQVVVFYESFRLCRPLHEARYCLCRYELKQVQRMLGACMQLLEF